MSANRNMYVISKATPLSPTTLHNIMNSQKVDPERAIRVLNLLKNGIKGWKEHRKAVFVEKTMKRSAKLTEIKLPSFGAKPVTQKRDTTPQTKNDIKPKAIVDAEKNISFVRERGMSITVILTHDLLVTCPLFEGDFPAEASNLKLVSETLYIKVEENFV